MNPLFSMLLLAQGAADAGGGGDGDSIIAQPLPSNLLLFSYFLLVVLF
jgi:hypothetical protein